MKYKLILLLSILLILSSFTGCKKEPDSETTDSSSNNDNNQTIVSEDTEEKEDIIYEGTSFTEIDFGESETMVGKADYYSLTDYISWGQNDIKMYGLTPVIENGKEKVLETGHTLYYSNTGEYFIISGEVPVAYINGKIYPTMYLREEGTGKRIKTFNNQMELDDFTSRWKSGQRVLSGETVTEEGTVIVDGCMTNIKYTKIDDETYFNLYDVFKEINPSTYYTAGSGEFNALPNGYNTVTIPTTELPQFMLETYGVNLLQTTFTFRSWNGGTPFEYEAPILDAKTFQISARDASKMFGWRMYTDGKALSIVSDKLNVTDEAVVYSYKGDSGISVKVEMGEDGNFYINTYDSLGNLISSVPYVDDGAEDEIIINDNTQSEEDEDICV